MNISNVTEFLNPENPAWVDPKTAQFVVLPFPLEKTTSYVRGTANGPQAILDASSQIEFFDPELLMTPGEQGIYTDLSLMNQNINEKDTKEVLDQASTIVANHFQQGKFVLALGGEHTVTPGVAQPFLDQYGKDLTILHVDAHADLKDTYEGSKWSHACAIRRVVQKSPIVSVGIRSVNEEEVHFAKEHPLITTFYSHDIANNPNWVSQAIDCVKTPYTYLTVDLDGLDPSIMPATGTPVPGGVMWNDLLTLIKGVAQKSKLVGADVNELCPLPNHHASEMLAAILCYKIMGYSLLK